MQKNNAEKPITDERFVLNLYYELQNITGNAFCKLVYICLYRTEKTNDCILSTIIAIVVTVLVLVMVALLVIIKCRFKIPKKGITKLFKTNKNFRLKGISNV